MAALRPDETDLLYGTFEGVGSPHNASPPYEQPAPSPSAKCYFVWRNAALEAQLRRHWPLLAVGALFIFAAFTHEWWRRPNIRAPADEEAEQEATPKFTEAAVFVSQGLDWQRVSYGGCDEAKASACVMFNDSMLLSGWSELWIRAVPHGQSYASYRRSMFAAGYAEGSVTHDRIHEHFWNTLETFFPDRVVPQKVAEFIADNLAWVRGQVAAHTAPQAPSSQYWQMVGGILAQFDGLVAGYQEFASRDQWLSELDLFLLNADGDLIDLIPAVNSTLQPKRVKRQSHLSYQEAVRSLRCSALIRLTTDRRDLLWGHTTWDQYSAMNRIYKHYDFPLPPAAGSAQRQVSFSSSPGYLTSADDWYLLDSQLAVMETTNGMYCHDLYALITPKSLLAWMRAYAANVLASSAPDWAQLFSAHNSGTYNNQWMVLDLSRFVVGTGLQEGGFVVVEQTPGWLDLADMTHTLNERGFWASYNIPYFDSIYKRSGFQEMRVTHRKDKSWSHRSCARAQIFAQRAPTVESLADLRGLLRYNDWRVDPLCRGRPSNGIAARYDLERDGKLFALEGGIDTKVTSASLAARMECWAVSGPTTQHNPAFDWRRVAPVAGVPHRGQPKLFNFSFVAMRPRAFHHSSHVSNVPSAAIAL
eukprot:GGOE01062753.1.p1 GENE.GGOE01062753.1~~GGOE01062753.1.p1  ORF type:complete len:653 (-),score=146.74 GGOE01062753.1:677-2608(-)